MKFICTQENLTHGIGLTAHPTGRSVGLPILNNVLLEVKNGMLVISSTNLEIGITSEVRGKVESEGSFTVDAKVFGDFVAMLPKGNVTIELIANQLSITCENFHTKIRGQEASEFPIIPKVDHVLSVVLSANEIRRALEQTVFAASTDEMRPEINGVLFGVSGKELLIVATDSYRLAEKKVVMAELVTGERKIIIPLKTLQEVERVLSMVDDESITVGIGDNQVVLSVHSSTVVSRLIEGDFPDYTQIVPESFSLHVTFDRRDMIQSVRAGALFSRSGVNDVHLAFQVSKKRVEVTTSNSQLGEYVAHVEASVVGGDEQITFNYKYLLDGLQALSGSKVVLDLNSSSTPAVLRSVDESGYMYLIMPIRQ